MKKRILTGLRPTGKLHVGHYLGMLKNTVKLQDEYEVFLMIANVQALTDNFDNPAKVKESIKELLLDFYAVGINFEKVTVFIQSEVTEIHEIFIYLSNFASIQQLSHHPTLKTELAQKGFGASTPLGFYIYPLHQAADILCVNADLVPVGKDQAPMVEDCRELARKFNAMYKTEALKQPEVLFGVEKNVPGIDGNDKMGKSLGNAIYLSDSEEELRKKVFQIKTDPNRIHATDPGTVEGNTVFLYHDAFNPNIEEVNNLKERYRKGTVGDVEVKEKLFVAMNNFLKPIRAQRVEGENKLDELVTSAINGSLKVRQVAQTTVQKMKQAMKIEFPTTVPAPTVAYEDFAKLDIRVGTVVHAEKVPDTDKLLRLEINFAHEKRQVLTALAEFYAPEDFIGKNIPVLVNLAPRQMRGLESQGMILATDNENGKPVFLIPESNVHSGAKVH